MTQRFDAMSSSEAENERSYAAETTDVSIEPTPAQAPTLNLSTGSFETVVRGPETLTFGQVAKPMAPLGHPLERLDPFDAELLRPVGAGGIAELWLARHPELERPFVLKLARPEFAGNPHVRAQFDREWRATRILRHPSILHHYSRGMDADERPYLTMDLVVGRPLSHFVENAITWKSLRAILIQLCDVLGFIHDRGVLHQDLKPSNVLLDYRNRRICVTDFGLARFGNREIGHTVKHVLGTPAYMAPEQARGQVGLQGPHTELYTMGVLLYELLAGHKPFEEEDERMAMIKHCSAAPPPLKIRAGIDAPQEVHQLVERLLAKSHTARYATTAELKAALKAL